MKFGLVLFDVDSTLIQQEVIDLLAARTSYGDRVAEITEKAMKGELDFDQALKERVELLSGLPESVFGDVIREITFSPGALALLAGLKERGFRIGVVSGGFHNVIDPLFEEHPLDFIRANTLEISDEKLTGRTIGPVINRLAKAGALQEFASMYDIELSRTIAVGDGSNDIEMIKLAGLGVSYLGKPVLRNVADLCIEVPGLEVLLDAID